MVTKNLSNLSRRPRPLLGGAARWSSAALIRSMLPEMECRRPRVLVVTPDVLAPQMAGPACRA